MSYKQMTAADIAALRELIGDDERVFAGEEIHEDYSHDELSGTVHYPDVVLRVLSAEEVSAVMRYASRERIPVTPRGAGTGLVGAAVAAEGGILLDMSLMNRFLELDEDNLTLTVEPGVLLMEIYTYVEEKGFFYPPDPAKNPPRSAATSAPTRRHARRQIRRHPRLCARVGGCAAERGDRHVRRQGRQEQLGLFDEGSDRRLGGESLGVVTKIILKLLPLPKRTVSLLVPFPSLRDAINTVPLIVRSKAAPTAVEFMEREVILDAEQYLGKKFPDHSADAYLILKFDGPSLEQIERDYEGVARLCLEQGALDVLISDTEEGTNGFLYRCPHH